MKPLLFLVPAALCVAAVIVIYIRKRRKEAGLRDAILGPQRLDSKAVNYVSDAAGQLLYDKCCRYMMEKRPFLADSFCLQDLARALFTNRAYLSRTINRFSGRNFSQYVNYYRVMYSMEVFRESPGLRVRELSLLSGFNSPTNFHHAFCVVMGMTPSEWCRSVRASMNSQRRHIRRH